MTERILAVYEAGVLRPLEPLQLKEKQQVYIEVVPQETLDDEGAAAIRVLVEAGLMRVPDRESPPPPDPVSKHKRRELAEALAKAPGKTLSEIVIEERGRP
jgi:predicted DNA-binding antitoxin AbrB/MazE fold protein